MAKKKVVESNERFFIVNPAGAVHEVTRDHAQARLGQVGYRAATQDEIKKYLEQGGNQWHDQPIAPRFTATPQSVDMSAFDGVEVEA